VNAATFRPMGRPVKLIVAIIAGAALVSVAVAVGLAGNDDRTVAPPVVPFSKLPGLQSGPPPWNNGLSTLNDRLKLLVLAPLDVEGKKLHIHQHLDVYVQGKRVTVPAHIGVQVEVGPKPYITEVHTHRADGIIHIESPVKRPFVLGQVFGEWGVRLTATCVGSSCGKLAWWVNGRRGKGDPARLVLAPHQEIVVAVGKPPRTIPPAFAFPAGY
jgi:hypothetical protein